MQGSELKASVGQIAFKSKFETPAPCTGVFPTVMILQFLLHSDSFTREPATGPSSDRSMLRDVNFPAKLTRKLKSQFQVTVSRDLASHDVGSSDVDFHAKFNGKVYLPDSDKVLSVANPTKCHFTFTAFDEVSKPSEFFLF